MKIAIIGTAHLKPQMLDHKARGEKEGHEIRMPALDEFRDLDELQICEYNLGIIRWAEEVHIFWDNRSVGTVFDFGMAFALNKPIRIVFLEKRTLAGVMTKYEVKRRDGNA